MLFFLHLPLASLPESRGLSSADLSDRASGQAAWNLKNIKGYPKQRKRLVPLIY